MTTETARPPDDLRQRALERLEKRAEFRMHLAAYILVNAVLVTLWFVMFEGGLFWPIFPMLGWGIGLAFHAMDVYRRPMTEERISREMQRLTATGHDDDVTRR
jgi:hypothetical protein